MPKNLLDPFHINAASTTPSNTHIFNIKAQVFKPKGPRLPTLSFGTAKCLDTSSINPALLEITKSKGGKVQMEDVSLIQSPSFTPVSPTQVKIEINEVSISLPPPSFQDVLLEEQINRIATEIRDTATTISFCFTRGQTFSNTEVGRGLAHLYLVLDSVYGNKARQEEEDPLAGATWLEDDPAWADDDKKAKSDNEWNPATEPPQGDKEHPPSQ
jgi:hypothetical protein